MFNNSQALSRLTVLELGSTVAGPFCGRLLADFGAQVVKVEDPGGDVLRNMGQSVNGKSLHAARSEERRVGKECRPLCRSRWSPYH